MKRIITLYLLCALAAPPVFSQTSDSVVTIAPYTQDEFARWMKDLRRFEIVSLGSIPFVTLGASLGYGFYRYFSHGMNMDYFPSLFSSGKDAGFSEGEQRNLFLISVGIGVAIGLIDFTIVQIKRARQNRASPSGEGSVITIEPLQTEVVQEEAKPFEQESAPPEQEPPSQETVPLETE